MVRVRIKFKGRFCVELIIEVSVRIRSFFFDVRIMV